MDPKISLSYTGYKMTINKETRHKVLIDAVNLYGAKGVIKRFAELSPLQKKYADVIAEDALYIMKRYGYNMNMITMFPSLIDTIQQYGPISLREFGYKINESWIKRRHALTLAVSSKNAKRVIKRLKEIAQFHIGKSCYSNIIDDIAWVEIVYCV